MNLSESILNKVKAIREEYVKEAVSVNVPLAEDSDDIDFEEEPEFGNFEVRAGAEFSNENETYIFDQPVSTLEGNQQVWSAHTIEDDLEVFFVIDMLDNEVVFGPTLWAKEAEEFLNEQNPTDDIDEALDYESMQWPNPNEVLNGKVLIDVDYDINGKKGHFNDVVDCDTCEPMSYDDVISQYKNEYAKEFCKQNDLSEEDIATDNFCDLIDDHLAALDFSECDYEDFLNDQIVDDIYAPIFIATDICGGQPMTAIETKAQGVCDAYSKAIECIGDIADSYCNEKHLYDALSGILVDIIEDSADFSEKIHSLGINFADLPSDSTKQTHISAEQENIAEDILKQLQDSLVEFNDCIACTNSELTYPIDNLIANTAFDANLMYNLKDDHGVICEAYKPQKLKIEFEYKDSLSNGKWNKQTCICSSLKQCKEFYGLGTDPDCEYHILSITDLNDISESLIYSLRYMKPIDVQIIDDLSALPKTAKYDYSEEDDQLDLYLDDVGLFYGVPWEISPLNESRVFRDKATDSYKIVDDHNHIIKSNGKSIEFPTEAEADEYIEDNEEEIEK